MKFEQNWPRGFKGEVNGRMHARMDRRRTTSVSIAHPEHSSGELKRSLGLPLYKK